MEQSASEVSKAPQESTEQNENILQKRSYEIEGAKINVSWKEFSPADKEASQDEAILFLTGWSAGTAKTLEYLSQRFAEDSGKTVFPVTTKTENVISDSLRKEAQAIKNMIIQKGLRKIILAAHSEGGIKAVDLIDILQKENSNIDIQGLILLDPVGLYEQGKAELISKFSFDTMVNTPMTLTKNLLKNPSLLLKGLQASSDILFNIVKEMATTKVVGYPTKLWSQIAEMAKANTHYQDVKCPVVLIQGAKDPVSSPNQVMSEKERIKYAQEAKERAVKAEEYRKSIPSTPGEDIRPPKWPHDPKWTDERNKAVQQALFPNSPSVHWLVPEKLGHHGVPHFRSKSISNASLGLLARYWKTQQSPAQITSSASQGETLQD